MADDKSNKQATLGYVRDSQSTIGCVGLNWRIIDVFWASDY